MKYTINQITQGEDELILNYRELNEEVEQVLAFMGRENRRLLGWKDNEQVVIPPKELLYMESVEGKTFGYTAQEVYRLNYTLQQLEVLLQSECFFRCSKSMIMNINMVASLQSLSSNRIDATMENGEHIMISRTYASDFRKRLRGE
jgi:DNA-binding LytR/AlgR family response regulator